MRVTTGIPGLRISAADRGAGAANDRTQAASWLYLVLRAGAYHPLRGLRRFALDEAHQMVNPADLIVDKGAEEGVLNQLAVVATALLVTSDAILLAFGPKNSSAFSGGADNTADPGAGIYSLPLASSGGPIPSLATRPQILKSADIIDLVSLTLPGGLGDVTFAAGRLGVYASFSKSIGWTELGAGLDTVLKNHAGSSAARIQSFSVGLRPDIQTPGGITVTIFVVVGNLDATTRLDPNDPTSALATLSYLYSFNAIFSKSSSGDLTNPSTSQAAPIASNPVLIAAGNPQDEVTRVYDLPVRCNPLDARTVYLPFMLSTGDAQLGVSTVGGDPTAKNVLTLPQDGWVESSQDFVGGSGFGGIAFGFSIDSNDSTGGSGWITNRSGVFSFQMASAGATWTQHYTRAATSGGWSTNGFNVTTVWNYYAGGWRDGGPLPGGGEFYLPIEPLLCSTDIGVSIGAGAKVRSWDPLTITEMQAVKHDPLQGFQPGKSYLSNAYEVARLANGQLLCAASSFHDIPDKLVQGTNTIETVADADGELWLGDGSTWTDVLWAGGNTKLANTTTAPTGPVVSVVANSSMVAISVMGAGVFFSDIQQAVVQKNWRQLPFPFATTKPACYRLQLGRGFLYCSIVGCFSGTTASSGARAGAILRIPLMNGMPSGSWWDFTGSLNAQWTKPCPVDYAVLSNGDVFLAMAGVSGDFATPNSMGHVLSDCYYWHSITKRWRKMGMFDNMERLYRYGTANSTFPYPFCPTLVRDPNNHQSLLYVTTVGAGTWRSVVSNLLAGGTFYPDDPIYGWQEVFLDVPFLRTLRIWPSGSDFVVTTYGAGAWRSGDNPSLPQFAHVPPGTS